MAENKTNKVFSGDKVFTRANAMDYILNNLTDDGTTDYAATVEWVNKLKTQFAAKHTNKGTSPTAAKNDAILNKVVVPFLREHGNEPITVADLFTAIGGTVDVTTKQKLNGIMTRGYATNVLDRKRANDNKTAPFVYFVRE